MIPARDPRRFDLVLVGATGFTGRLVAAYLTRRTADTSLRWALAGRDRARLEAIRAELAAIDRAAGDLPLITADSHDDAAMAGLAADTRVVCTTVGPYLEHGGPLVRACAEAGTDYCDLTGEVPFIRRSIDRHHQRAVATGARLVHAAGFDSVPSDLGTLVLQDALLRDVGGPARSVLALYGQTGAALSGGTIASMLGLLDAARRDPAMRRLLADPYALDPVGPAGAARGPDRDHRGVGYDRECRAITAPFVMAAINGRVVRRSHALLGRPWGADFAYDERTVLPVSAAGLAHALALAAGLAGVAVASQIPALRRLVERRLPRPGQGPSAERMARGRFEVRLHGAVGDLRRVAIVADELEPGYGATAKMLGEAALSLVEDPPVSGGGVLTPAVALGLPLVARLRTAGMRWDVEDDA